MDRVSRLTTRQRLRRLRFGLGEAFRLALAAVLLVACAAFLAGLFVGSAHAIGFVNGTNGTCTGYSPYPYAPTGCVSAQVFCDAYAPAQGQYYPPSTAGSVYGFVVGSGNGTYCYVEDSTTRPAAPGNPGGGSIVTGTPMGPPGVRTNNVPTCPANSTATAGNCVCDVGFKGPLAGQNPTVCRPTTCGSRPNLDRNAGPFTNQSDALIGLGVMHSYCDAIGPPGSPDADWGCTIRESLVGARQGPDGRWYSRFLSAYNASSCNESATNDVVNAPSGGVVGVDSPASAPRFDPPVAPATACAGSTCPGTVNGTQVCVACSRTVTAEVTSTIGTGASGVVGTGTTTSSSYDCSGSVCVRSTTTTTGTSSTTTTAVVPASSVSVANGGTAVGGGSGGTGSGDGAASAPQSTFAGVCAGTACTGDAVQCAIAQEQYKRNCQMAANLGDGTLTPTMQAAIDATTGGSRPTDHPRTDANVDSRALSSFDQTDILSGACPGDYTVPGRYPVVLTFSKMCGPAEMLGNVLIGLTALTCLGIVFLRGK